MTPTEIALMSVVVAGWSWAAINLIRIDKKVSVVCDRLGINGGRKNRTAYHKALALLAVAAVKARKLLARAAREASR